jgi:hypothetical protein
VAGSCERRNETSVAIKGGKCINQLNNYQLLLGSATWSNLLSATLTQREIRLGLSDISKVSSLITWVTD